MTKSFIKTKDGVDIFFNGWGARMRNRSCSTTGGCRYSLAISSMTPEDDPHENLKRVIQAGSADGIIITRMVADDPRQYPDLPLPLRAADCPFRRYGYSWSQSGRKSHSSNRAA
ncbi:hypothetical protein O8B93_16875 [Agrobacterium rhizogenes]|uniref:hypothetical protein n=1 Tax=Rhizobium rhizogenes TaxID=359 RepID=UPI0022B734AB|nr:hypothetical protein [Rhizobium rhizogenes]MCZ7449264.1 hypothetical protein [Rhizobium rhizogenes]